MLEGTSQAHERTKKPSSDLPRSAKGMLSAADPADALTELFLGSGLADLGVEHTDDIPLPPLRMRVPLAAPSEVRAASVDGAAFTSTLLRDPAQKTAGHIEVVIVGHLPVLASAWVHQYSRTRQRGLDEPVALLRLRGGSASLDLLSNVPPTNLPELNSLESACRAAAEIAKHWIISTDEVWEPEMASHAGVSTVTLLTGANDAALVASYRALKGLCQAGGEGLTASLRVVFLGGPQDKATVASKRIAATAAVFLSRPLAIEILPDKIGPGRSVPLFVGNFDASANDLVAQVARLAGSASETRDAAKTAAHVPPPCDPQVARLSTRIPGLTAVSPRCPYAPEIELAIGEAGDIHLLSAGSDAASIDRAVGSLAVAGAWVRTNADVLRAAIPELACRVRALEVREHLVTTSPKAARRLLDTPLRVHVCMDETSPFIDLN